MIRKKIKTGASLFVVFCVCCGATLLPANAKSASLTPVTKQCILQASRYYQVPIAALMGILAQERGVVGNCRENTNGSVDCGPMQINSVHLPALQRYGITRDVLQNNGCLNVFIGAWVLATEMDRAPSSLWAAIGNYHSRTPHLNARYQLKVFDRLQKQIDVDKILKHVNRNIE